MRFHLGKVTIIEPVCTSKTGQRLLGAENHLVGQQDEQQLKMDEVDINLVLITGDASCQNRTMWYWGQMKLIRFQKVTVDAKARL